MMIYPSGYITAPRFHNRYIGAVQGHVVGYEIGRSTSVDYRDTEIDDTVGQRTHGLIESRLLDIARPPEAGEYEDTRPTKKALAYGFELVRYLEEAGLDLTDLQIWPTDNRTIEFSLRRDSDNEISFETGTNGISGNVYIRGERYGSRAACPDDQKKSIVALARRYGGRS
ncbi:MAG: hypothetical protein LKF99_03810 [Bifidobacterium sp.]|jgi:hypothetical protein|nr:hypothetical protein [Bifidobacterium sp.]